MKQAGWIAVAVSFALFVAALTTVYEFCLSLNVGLNPVVPWQVQAAAEALLGFMFLIAGVALVGRRTT